MNNQTYLLTVGQIFTLFFVMIGPLRLIGPFTQATLPLKSFELKKLATSATLIATVSLIVSGVLGSKLLSNWHIEAPVMLLAGGIVFFLAALRPLIANSKPHKSMSEKNVSLKPQDVALELELTPYGMATIIVLMSVSTDSSRIITIFACLLTIMLLNALCMMFGRQILHFIGTLPMRILGAALGVLQLGLATEIIIKSINSLRG